MGGEPPNVVAWSPRSKPRIGQVRGQQRPDRKAAREALGDGDRVGPDACELLAEPRAAAADPGLHLVVQEQRAVPVAQLARELEPGGVDRPDPALALDRLDEHRAGRVGRRRARARRGRCAGRARSRRAPARTARAWRPTSRRRALPACGRGTRPRRTRCGAWPARRERAPTRRASLMRGLDGLGAGVAEERAILARRARTAARRAPPSARCRTGSRRGRARPPAPRAPARPTDGRSRAS